MLVRISRARLAKSRATFQGETRGRFSPPCSDSTRTDADSEWRQPENSRRAKFYSLTRSGKKQSKVGDGDWHVARRAHCALVRRGLTDVSLAQAHCASFRALTHRLPPIAIFWMKCRTTSTHQPRLDTRTLP